jgi:DNA-binding transcriptional LysR family regulator
MDGPRKVRPEGYAAANRSVHPANRGITCKLRQSAGRMSHGLTLRVFVPVYEPGSVTAAAGDQRTSPVVPSARNSEHERLFNLTTPTLWPTENGRLFHDGACRVLEAIDEAEAAVIDATGNPRGTLFEVARQRREGRLAPVAAATPPRPVQRSILTPHRRLRDPKVRLFGDFMIGRVREPLRATEG